MTQVWKSFGSDNHAGVHPAVLKAIQEANVGHVPAYGNDPTSERAKEIIRAELGQPHAEIFFVFTGTAANTLSIRSACRPFEAVVATDIAHINEDECGAPEYNTGSKILGFPHVDGKLPLSVIENLTIEPKDSHRVLPKLVSITQATEMGTVYKPDEVRALADIAHKRGLYLHMDGARLSNAIVGAGTNTQDMLKGVDVLSLGGTKNGLLCGEAVVFLNPELGERFAFIRKQSMQLLSKGRYLSCQFIPYFAEGIWRKNAEQANAMAKYLRSSLIKACPEAQFPYATEANEVFVILPDELSKRVQKEGPAYLWDKQTGLIRLVCSYDTEVSDIDNLIRRII